MDISNAKKIRLIRKEMEAENIDAYIIPTSDPHQSEYPASHWKSREWLSGFTGSSGTLVITKDHAGLWTDSRYFIQAEYQLKDSPIKLHKLTIPHTPEHLLWLCDNLSDESKVGLDGTLFSVGQMRGIAKRFYDKKINISSEIDLLNKIWADRPSIPTNTVFELPIQYAGESRNSKLSRICDTILERQCHWHLLTALDNIAWTFNLRGEDVKCNPVFVAYAVIGLEKSYFFIDKNKVPEDIQMNLVADNVFIKPYTAINDFLKSINQPILIDISQTNNEIYNQIPEEYLVQGESIIPAMQAVKNETEIANIKEAMIKDGVALTRLFRWLDKELDKRTISEVEVAEKLSALRKAQGDYFGESFDAIVGYKGNGAIVHYRAEEATCAHLSKEGILLLDSGGQYLQGTTDITRTVALGNPTEEQKRNFTLVLKGHIGLARLHFLKGTRGNQIEILARQHLWQHGLNYGHGTGHGVGYFLNVHEGPQSIGSGLTGKSAVAFEKGMYTSNEPGFYKENEYGIRIENLVIATDAQKTAYGEFLKFDTVTLFPIDQNLIDINLLNKEEKDWLNNYHQTVFEKLAPHLEAAEVEWMREMCKAV